MKIRMEVTDNVVFNEFSNFPNAFVGQETVNDSYLRQR